jgi:hypothetical protein
MIGRPEDDHIQLFLDTLAQQTFRDFEVIIADCIYDRREIVVEDNTYRGKKYPFQIYHMKVNSPWLKHGAWAGQAPWNHGALLARGELFLTFGDCCELPPHYLERIWDWYTRGYWCMGLVIYKKDGKLFYYDEELARKAEVKSMTSSEYNSVDTWEISSIIRNLAELKRRGIIKDLVRDSRWTYVDNVGVVKLKGRSGAQQFHGYASVPLQALLRINGFDENFDGDKSLGDVDCGIKLWMAGYDNVLVLDKDVWLYENAHKGVPEDVLWYKGPSIRSNFSLLCLNELKRRWRANSYRLTEEEVDWMCEHAKDWGFRDIDMKANPMFQKWLKYPPIFDLQELRWRVQFEDEIVEIPEYYVWGD